MTTNRPIGEFAKTNETWCSTCGKNCDLDNVDENFDCPECQEWWNLNAPA